MSAADVHSTATGAPALTAAGFAVPNGAIPTPARVARADEERTLAERLYRSPYEFDFFQAVLLLERLEPARRAVGQEGSAASEVVRFRAADSLVFPPSTVCALAPAEHDGEPDVMTVAFMGLTGPSGVLPRHYSELVLRLARDGKGNERGALADWFNQFNHRLISLFFRAWAKYRHVVPFARQEYRRREPDVFTTALFSLFGMGAPTVRDRLVVSARHAEDRRAAERVVARIDDLALLYYGGLLAQRPRSAVNLERLLVDYFGLPVEVRQFQGQWLSLDDDSQTRVATEPANNRLGIDVVVGARVWDVQSKIQIRLGPLSYDVFLEFLPAQSASPRQKSMFVLAHLVRLFLGVEHEFDVQLVLEADQTPACRLVEDEVGGPRLGWNTWLRTEPMAADADDSTFSHVEVRWLNQAALN